MPVTTDDVVAPGDAIIAKIDALISRARLMVVDASSNYTVNELRLALKKMDNSRILIITTAGISLPVDIAGTRVLKRPDTSSNEGTAQEKEIYVRQGFLKRQKRRCLVSWQA